MKKTILIMMMVLFLAGCAYQSKESLCYEQVLGDFKSDITRYTDIAVKTNNPQDIVDAMSLLEMKGYYLSTHFGECMINGPRTGRNYCKTKP